MVQCQDLFCSLRFVVTFDVSSLPIIVILERIDLFRQRAFALQSLESSFKSFKSALQNDRASYIESKQKDAADAAERKDQ